MSIRKLLALLLALAMMMSLCSCADEIKRRQSMGRNSGSAYVEENDDEAEYEAEDEAESGEETEEEVEATQSADAKEFGLHDEDGYHIVNKCAYTHPDGYKAKHVNHSYDTLNKTQKSIYEKLLDGAYCFSDTESSTQKGTYELKPIVLDGTDYQMKDVEAAFTAITDDHPEIFWMARSYSTETSPSDNTTTLKFCSDYKADEVVSMMKELDGALGKFYADLPAKLSGYDLELYIYKYILDNSVYDDNYNSSDSYVDEHPYLSTLYGMMVKNSIICEGYSRAFDYLCSELGIDTVCIGGYSVDDENAEHDGEPHMWNAANVDNDWYMVDATWDDWDGAEDLGEAFTYLNVTTSDIELDHKINQLYTELSEDEVEDLETAANNYVPSCTATKDCYYLLESTKMTSPDDVDTLAGAMVKASGKESKSMMIYVDSDSSAEDFAGEMFSGSQPYYEAMEKANEKTTGKKLDKEAKSSFYPNDDRNLLIFELKYV